MSFTITITETKIATTLQGKEWGVIGTKEVEREQRWWRDPNVPEARVEEVRGYTPEVEKKVVVEVERLKQTVETLDLAAVIKAINGL